MYFPTNYLNLFCALNARSGFIWKGAKLRLFCTHPLWGLCFFRFHFPEGSNVKIVQFVYFFHEKIVFSFFVIDFRNA